MAGLFSEIFSQDFVSQYEITVTHNAGHEGLFVRVFVDNIARGDLIQSVVPTPTNPTNEFVVTLNSVQTGSIQVLETDLWPAALPSTAQRPWLRVHNLDATSDPTASDDETQGYDIGSLWVNTTEARVWQAISVSIGAAVWKQLTEKPGGFPGQFVLGSPLIYSGQGSFSADEVQYTKVYLPAGITIDRMRTWIGGTTGPSKSVRMGIYSQSDPTDAGGSPNTREAQTNAVEVSDNSANVLSLTSAYTTPTAGYYWFAIVRSSAGGQFNIQQTDSSYPNEFLENVVQYQSTSGTALPATASGLSSNTSAVVYVAALEQ